jgi:hypothetical protein
MANDSNASARLSSLVKETAKDMRMTEEQALNCVLATEEGKDLWEQQRLEELRGSRVLGLDGDGGTIMLLHSLVREMTKTEKMTGEMAFNRLMATKEGAALFARSRLEQIEASKWHRDDRQGATCRRLSFLLSEIARDQKSTADEISARVVASERGKAL